MQDVLNWMPGELNSTASQLRRLAANVTNLGDRAQAVDSVAWHGKAATAAASSIGSMHADVNDFVTRLSAAASSISTAAGTISEAQQTISAVNKSLFFSNSGFYLDDDGKLKGPPEPVVDASDPQTAAAAKQWSQDFNSAKAGAIQVEDALEVARKADATLRATLANVFSGTDGNSTSVWQLGAQWVAGVGPATQYFGDGDPFTIALEQSSWIKGLQAGIANGTLPNSGIYRYSLNGVKGVVKYTGDVIGGIEFGNSGDLALTYLGSAVLHYTVKDGVITVKIVNNSDARSATHVPIVGYTKVWNEYVGKTLDNLFSSGPLSSKTQVITFHILMNK